MKLLLLTFVVTICYANADKAKRLLAAMNAGLMTGMNGGLANGVIPGMLAGGLNPVLVAGGGAGVFGQPQFAQVAPGLRVFAFPATIPNMYPVPAVNTLPFMGVPQSAPMNPPQQPLMGIAVDAMQQQYPLQPDPFRRFKRQIMKQDNAMKATMDTQIPAPTETPTTTSYDDGHEDN